MKRCPKCSSLNVNPYANSFENFMCEDCGNIGPVIYEDDEFEEELDTDETQAVSEDEEVE